MRGWLRGVWASERRSSLVFDSELKQADKIRIYLEVKCPPRSSEISLVVNAGAELASFKLYDWNRFISFEGLVGENGRVTISLLARGRFGDVDHRSIHTGLTSVAYCDGSDPLPALICLRKLPFIRRLSISGARHEATLAREAMRFKKHPTVPFSGVLTDDPRRVQLSGEDFPDRSRRAPGSTTTARQLEGS
jgi:hypothetical protein